MHLKKIRQIGFLPQVGLNIIKQIETTTCLHVSFGYCWDFGVKLIEQWKKKGSISKETDETNPNFDPWYDVVPRRTSQTAPKI